MKVLHVAHGIYPFRQAGTEIYTAELARTLAGQGLEVHVAFPDPGKPVPADGGPARLHPVPLAPPSRFGNKLRRLRGRPPFWYDELRRLLGEVRPDLVHVQHACGFGLSALELLGRHAPLVLTLPDFWLLCPGILRRCRGDFWACARGCCGEVPVRRLGTLPAAAYLAGRRRFVRRLVERRRPTLAAISDATRVAFEREGFPADLLLTHKWGIDDAHIRREVQKRRAPDPGRPRVGYLGTVRPHKGCHVLLEAFTREPRAASLHFHGDGDRAYLEGLKDRARGHDVHFHGRFDHAEVAGLLANLDLVVIPSIWDETYCLVFQEAMAARVPAIASAVGGLADRMTHGQNGFLVPPGDVGALASRLGAVLEDLPRVRAGLDYDRCAVHIDDDARGWVGIYERTLERCGKERPAPRRRTAPCLTNA